MKVVAEEGLAPFFFYYLRSSSNALIPSAELETLRRSFLASAARHLSLEQTLVQILGTFEERGVSCLVLKGMALAYLVYPDPATRTMSDIDLLIHPHAIGQASEALGQLGYRAVRQYEEYKEELCHFGGELAFVKTGGPLVELHWMLEQYERLRGLIHIDEESLWQRAVSYSLNGTQAKALSAEDQVLTLSIHLGLVHRMKGVKWLLDIDQLIRTLGREIDGFLLVNRAKQWGIYRLLCHVLWACQETFHTPFPAGVKGRALRGAKGLLGSWLFLDRWQDRFRMLQRVFFPSSDWLRFRYRLKKEETVLPYRIFHPVRLLFGRLP